MAASARAAIGDLVLIWPKGRRGVFLPVTVKHASGTGFVRRVTLADGDEIGWREIHWLEAFGQAAPNVLDQLRHEYDDKVAAREAIQRIT